MNYFLSEAEEPIRKALERLIAKDESKLPFVLVDKVGNPDIFVQFATKNRVLYFDSPPLHVTIEAETLDRGTDLAIAGLFSLGVAFDQRVLIHEDDQRKPPPRDHVPFWKRFAPW